ncbi:MAG: hypothetical protein NWR72_11100 [Bacteroidia bacterium]|nr:hypothetical protein [Bacteroidia bacterium]
MKPLFSTALLALFSLMIAPASAQVAKKVVAEHFTNTRCSICAGKNPGLKQNYAANPEVLVLTIHPSAPYSSCIFNQHNKNENDARTNFYNIYGATPRLVIQGEVLSSSVNFAGANLFSGYQGKTTPFSLAVKEIRRGTDSVTVEVTVKAVSAHSEVDGKLYVAYVENSVGYNAPNGETEHINVFRKAFSPAGGASITLPVQGDSLVWAETIDISEVWVLEQMQVIAILQNQLNLVLQAESTTELDIVAATSIDNDFVSHIRLYPNPVKDVMIAEGLLGEWRILGIDGKLWANGQATLGATQSFLSTKELPAGVYFLENEGTVARFLKE